ncbi:MAG: hypothetical protein QNJ46_01570 [Leptolyngbyaceae cyanobacterium MO_188.B28]|nr:hypothetical protein [Leptolyngbyaceae cyanobacterium MO_188.B28]
MLKRPSPFRLINGLATREVFSGQGLKLSRTRALDPSFEADIVIRADI